MNIEKVITELVLIIVFLYVANAMYPPLLDVITNITGTYGNTAMVLLITILYWILVSASVLLYFVKVFIPKMRRS